MPRRSNLLTYVALGWLVALVLAANAGIPVPDGFGTTVFFLTPWSLWFLYFRLCRRWPVVGWLALGLIVGLFGGGYSNSTATTFIEREEYDDTNCDIYDNCDNCDN